jgi:toxin YoeB
MAMPYRIVFSPEALADLQKLAQNEPKSYAKAKRFIDELKEHPKTGLGHPEPLKGKPENRWSREITKKHRLVYEIRDTEVVVLVLAAYGHYYDK